MALCKSCQEITLSNLLKSHLLHENWESLQQSAKTCSLCDAILLLWDKKTRNAYKNRQIKRNQELTDFHGHEHQGTAIRGLPQTWYNGVDTAIRLCLSRGGRPLGERVSSSRGVVLLAECEAFPRVGSKSIQYPWEEFSISSGSRDYGDIELPVFVNPGDPLTSWQITQYRTLPESAGDESNLTIMRNWIDECSTNHQKCNNKVQTDSALPRRLIDISCSLSTGILKVLDVQTDFHQPYVALTYCWGASAGGKDWLDYVRHSQRTESSCSLVRLPQTLQDVVRLSYRLGYSMLWIDALCIIQGDEQDWQTESAKMDHIYGGAALTISTGDSEDCRDGCIPPRSQIEREGVVLQLFTDKKELCSLHIDVGNFELKTATTHGAVASRAWCLQEARLSNRLLHVFRAQVVFECLERRYCERECRPNNKALEDYSASVNIDSGHSDGVTKPTAYLRNVAQWNSLVVDYTARSLTNSNDKLVAISGLAKKAGETLCCQYLAGIWAQQLELGLSWACGVSSLHSSWQAGMPGTRVPRRAPSWSWAAVDGPVGWLMRDLNCTRTESTIELLDASISSDNQDLYGQVSGGVLRVAARIKIVPATSMLPNESMTWPRWLSGRAKQSGCYLEDEHKVLQGDLTCLQIGLQQHGIGLSIPSTSIVLLLQHERGSTYRRIGTGLIFPPDAFDQCERQILSLI